MKDTRSFTTTILWAFILLNISSLIIFTFSVKYEDGERALTSAKTSMTEIVTEKASLISISLKNIEDKTEDMASWMEYFLAEETAKQMGSSYFVNKDNGTVERKAPVDENQNNYSAIFFPKDIPLTGEIIQEINATEKMDQVFHKVLKQDEMLKWVYIATDSELLRVQPFYDVKVFDANHKQTQDTFYNIAVQQNNPEKNSVWTVPYVDYLGTGWTMSCSHPIYDTNGAFFGVVCADVGIEELRQRFFEGFKLGESGKIYLLTDLGDIIYHPDYKIRAEKQGALYNQNIFDDRNLSETKVTMLKRALHQNESVFEFMDKGQNKLLAGSRIEGQPWTVVIEINKEEFLSQNRIDGKVLLQLIFIGIVLAFVLVIILYFEFSIPMRSLMDGVRTISKGDFGRVRNNTGFSEINELSEAFNNMNDNLQNYTESILRKNNEITTILNAIDGGLMIIDVDRNVKIANKQSEGRIFRENKNSYKCFGILSNGNEICENCILNYILEGKQRGERQVIIDGEIYRNTYYPIIEASGEIREIVILSQCITKSIAMEGELQQMEKMAGIGQFSAAIAHEIKNPLAVIKGATYIMNVYNKEASEAGAYTEEIELIENAVREAEHVISTLLDFSAKETESGGFVDFKKLIEQILMISRKEIIKRGIEVEVNVAAAQFYYNGRIEIIKIILQNLINNSIQAVENNGYICVYANKESENKILITITDNGPGISMKPRRKIFEPFSTTKKENGGTGIGLWITKTLVDGIGGSICVNEEKSDGTEIYVVLPLLKEENMVMIDPKEVQ